MKYTKRSIIGMLVACMVLIGTPDLYARGGGGHGGGGYRGGGGWSGSRGGGGHAGGERFDGGHEFNRDHDFNRGDFVRPNPDRDHHRPTPPTPPAPPPPPTYNVNVNAPDGWYGGADDALMGMAMGTMVGAAAASNRDSQPDTVIVEQSPVIVAQAAAVGSQSAMLPSGSQARTVNGTIYYQNGETWYRPYFGTGGVYYEVVPSPGEAGK